MNDLLTRAVAAMRNVKACEKHLHDRPERGWSRAYLADCDVCRALVVRAVADVVFVELTDDAIVAVVSALGYYVCDQQEVHRILANPTEVSIPVLRSQILDGSISVPALKMVRAAFVAQRRALDE